jgi:hypothetical protein
VDAESDGPCVSQCRFAGYDLLEEAIRPGRIEQRPHDFQNSCFIVTKRPVANRTKARATALAGGSRTIRDERPLKAAAI